MTSIRMAVRKRLFGRRRLALLFQRRPQHEISLRVVRPKGHRGPHLLHRALEFAGLPARDANHIVGFGKLGIDLERPRQFGLRPVDIILILQRDSEVVVGGRVVRIAGQQVPEDGNGPIQFGFLEKANPRLNRAV